MSSIVISGDTSGAVTLQAPNIAGTTTLTLPTTSGILTVGGSLGVDQTWQGVTRVMGTTYINDTGKPIMIVARADRSGVSTAGIGISFNGGGVIPICFSTNSNGGNTAVGSIVVPVGAAYVLSVISESLTSYSIWELR